MIDKGAQHAESLFKRRLSTIEVEDLYRPCVYAGSEKYRPFVRAKVQLERGVRCWSRDGGRCELPEDWRSVEFESVVQVKGIYLTSCDCGLILEVRDALILEDTADLCPFEVGE